MPGPNLGLEGSTSGLSETLVTAGATGRAPFGDPRSREICQVYQAAPLAAISQPSPAGAQRQGRPRELSDRLQVPEGEPVTHLLRGIAGATLAPVSGLGQR